MTSDDERRKRYAVALWRADQGTGSDPTDEPSDYLEVLAHAAKAVADEEIRRALEDAAEAAAPFHGTYAPVVADWLRARAATVASPAREQQRCGGTKVHPSHTFMRMEVLFQCPGVVAPPAREQDDREAILALHSKGEHNGLAICLECATLTFPPPETGIWSESAYPCATLRALGVTDDGAAVASPAPEAHSCSNCRTPPDFTADPLPENWGSGVLEASPPREQDACPSSLTGHQFASGCIYCGQPQGEETGMVARVLAECDAMDATMDAPNAGRWRLRNHLAKIRDIVAPARAQDGGEVR